jgi:hypothetical protein
MDYKKNSMSTDWENESGNKERAPDKQRRPPSKKKKRGKKLIPKNMKACHNMNTVLMHNIAEIGTQINMKSSRKTLH